MTVSTGISKPLMPELAPEPALPVASGVVPAVVVVSVPAVEPVVSPDVLVSAEAVVSGVAPLVAPDVSVSAEAVVSVEPDASPVAPAAPVSVEAVVSVPVVAEEPLSEPVDGMVLPEAEAEVPDSSCPALKPAMKATARSAWSESISESCEQVMLEGDPIAPAVPPVSDCARANPAVAVNAKAPTELIRSLFMMQFSRSIVVNVL